jgi:hypothetical protein
MNELVNHVPFILLIPPLQLTALNGQAGYMFVMTAPGKSAGQIHKDIREVSAVLCCARARVHACRHTRLPLTVDDQLKSKMAAFLEDCSAEDVAVVISGDGG